MTVRPPYPAHLDQPQPTVEALPKFDPRGVPVMSIDSHLPAVADDRLTAEAMRQRFKHPPVWTPENSVEKRLGNRPIALAAVLLPLVMRNELNLLLTVRAEALSTHSGQIAFPGGKVDASDRDAVHTALREAHEEIGLPEHHIEVLGTLPTYLTGTAFVVTPVVALVKPGFELYLNPHEVTEVFEVPLRYLMNPAHHRQHALELEGSSRQWLSMPYTAASGASLKEHYIWGATAGMLRNLYRFLAT